MKVYVIHGCPSGSEEAMERNLDPEKRTWDRHWIPWIKAQLSAIGIDVETPSMPNPWDPVYEAFKEEFDKYPVSEDSILIGHSCGTTFLTRWLGDTKQKVAKLILVAPWFIADEDTDSSRRFYEYSLDPSIKDRVKEIIMFTSDNEHEDGKKSVKKAQEVFGGRVITLKNHGHYVIGEMGTEEFPELLEVILE